MFTQRSSHLIYIRASLLEGRVTQASRGFTFLVYLNLEYIIIIPTSIYYVTVPVCILSGNTTSWHYELKTSHLGAVVRK